MTGRLREIEHDKEAQDEAGGLDEWLKLTSEESEIKKKLKDAEADLDGKTYKKYPILTELEIKTLVVDEKWLAALDIAVHGEMDSISKALSHRVKELVERYETPFPQMVTRVADLERKVDRHLEEMGFAWK